MYEGGMRPIMDLYVLWGEGGGNPRERGTVFRFQVHDSCIISFIRHYMKMTLYGRIMKVCEWDTIFQLQVYEREPFLTKWRYTKR